MSTILYILLAILMLAILIVAHEFGHFTAARLMKIDVREFSVGFGPRLLGWKSKKHETDFSVRLIPLGGYCAFSARTTLPAFRKTTRRRSRTRTGGSGCL